MKNSASCFFVLLIFFAGCGAQSTTPAGNQSATSDDKAQRKAVKDDPQVKSSVDDSQNSTPARTTDKSGLWPTLPDDRGAMTPEEKEIIVQLADKENQTKEAVCDFRNQYSFSFRVVLKKTSNEDIEPISRLPRLTELNLESKKTTDVAFQYLEGLKYLNSIRVGLPLGAGQPGDIKLTDASLKHLKNLENLHHLILMTTEITGDGLAHLEVLPLKTLILYKSFIDDRALEHVGRLKNVADLRLDGNQITGIGCRYLKGMAALETLSLASNPIEGGALMHLAACPKLTDLDLASCDIDDEGLRGVGMITSLKRLVLSRTKITSSGLAHLSKLEILEDLDLSNTQVDNDVFRSLAKLPSLRRLTMAKTQIDDDAIPQILKIRSLRLLSHFNSTGLTEDGAKQLKAKGNIDVL